MFIIILIILAFCYLVICSKNTEESAKQASLITFILVVIIYLLYAYFTRKVG